MVAPGVPDASSMAVLHPPPVPGLAFRGLRGVTDFPIMVEVIEGSKKADSLAITDSVDEIARFYQNLANCDPYERA